MIFSLIPLGWSADYRLSSAAWQRQNLALDHHGLERECAVALENRWMLGEFATSTVGNNAHKNNQKHVPFSTQRASFSGLELAWIGFLQGAGLFYLVSLCSPGSFRTAARSKLGRMAGPASVARRSFSEVTTEVKQPKARAVICFILIHATWLLPVFAKNCWSSFHIRGPDRPSISFI